VEHAPELEAGDASLQRRDVGLDADDRLLVFLGAGEFEQFSGVVQALIDVAQRDDYAFEGFLFLAQVLGALGIVPDFRVFQGAADFFQLRLLAVEVKDTSADRRCGRADRTGGWRGR